MLHNDTFLLESVLGVLLKLTELLCINIHK
jgi:hypothetical protein